jgi:enamine deaminase RidA (YjgF/YER057c/UK114 family)
MTQPDTQSQPSTGIEAKLGEFGHVLPAVVAPVASYVPAGISGNYVYTSGQLPMVDGALPATGKVGEGTGLVDPATAAELAERCALNALAAVKSVIGDLEKIVRVVKVVGFVSSDPSFTGQPQVINGASNLLVAALGDRGVHARSAVGVAVLPLDSPVEVEIVVEFRKD